MRKLLLTLLVLLSLLVVSALAALCIGEISFSPGELLALRDAPEDDIRLNILMQLRVPRILLGLIAGGALSLAGVILQGIFRNPLVEPYTLGISGGASVGVTLAILLGLHTAYGGLALSLAGFLGALATIFVVYGLGIRRGQVRIQTLLLTGVMISFISSSLMLLMMSLSKTEDLPGIVFWIMGSLAETDGALITLLCITSFLVLLLSFLYAPQLNAMRLGSERAMQLGVDTDRVIKLLFVFSSLLTGICVSIVGVIGFVGLIVPHACLIGHGQPHPPPCLILRWRDFPDYLGHRGADDYFAQRIAYRGDYGDYRGERVHFSDGEGEGD